MMTTVKFVEYNISNDKFHFVVQESDDVAYNLSVTGETVARIFQELADGSDVSVRDRCIASLLEGTEENGDSTGEYTDGDPCELVGNSASM